MALDILEGDILVVNGSDFKIRRAAFYAFRHGANKSSFEYLSTVDCTTKRNDTSADSGDANLIKFNAASVANLTDLKCLPLDSIRPKLAMSEGFGRTHNISETWIGEATGYWHLWVEKEL